MTPLPTDLLLWLILFMSISSNAMGVESETLIHRLRNKDFGKWGAPPLFPKAYTLVVEMCAKATQLCICPSTLPSRPSLCRAVVMRQMFHVSEQTVQQGLGGKIPVLERKGLLIPVQVESNTILCSVVLWTLLVFTPHETDILSYPGWKNSTSESGCPGLQSQFCYHGQATLSLWTSVFLTVFLTLRVGPEQWFLYLNVHHSPLQGWSEHVVELTPSSGWGPAVCPSASFQCCWCPWSRDNAWGATGLDDI